MAFGAHVYIRSLRADARAAMAEVRRMEGEIDAQQERFTSAQALANAKLRAQEQAQRAKDDAAEAERVSREAEIDKMARRLAVERGRVRDDIATFTRGPGPADDTIARCRSETERIGVVLDEALRTSEACAADGEHDAALARRLLDGRR